MEKAGFIEKAGRENFCENIDKTLETRTLDKVEKINAQYID